MRQAEEQQAAQTEAQRQRIEEAKKRIIRWIESQLTINKYSEIKDKSHVSDTCGICIDEFENADEANEDYWVAETP